MAATQYQIFCRYYHSTVNRAVLNETTCKWIQAEDRIAPRTADNVDAGGGISYFTDTVAEENLWIRYEDWMQSTSETYDKIRERDIANKKKVARDLDSKLSVISINEASIQNPKFDMVFVYEGISSVTGKAPINTKHSPNGATTPVDVPEGHPAPIVYYEKMARFIMSPWFVYATGSSLKWALTKAEDLVRIVGVENVIIGKVVDLDQYIEIV